ESLHATRGRSPSVVGVEHVGEIRELSVGELVGERVGPEIAGCVCCIPIGPRENLQLLLGRKRPITPLARPGLVEDVPDPDTAPLGLNAALPLDQIGKSIGPDGATIEIGWILPDRFNNPWMDVVLDVINRHLAVIN